MKHLLSKQLLNLVRACLNLFIYLFNSDSRFITEKKNTTTKKQNKIKQQKLHRMIQIQKFKN